MIQIVTFFTAPFLAAYLMEKKSAEKYSVKTFICVLFAFAAAINMLCMGVVSCVFNHPDYVINELIFSTNFVFKYLLISLCFAGALPTVIGLVRKWIKIEFIVEKKVQHNDANDIDGKKETSENEQ